MREDEHPIVGEYGCGHHPLAKLNEERGLRPSIGYDSEHPYSFNDFQQFTTPLPISRKIAALVAELVPLEAHFIDAGCGNGALSVGLMELGYRGGGVEADLDAMAISLNDWNHISPFPLSRPVDYDVEETSWCTSKVRNVDFVVSNPPFYRGFDFIAAAMKRSNVLFFLLPATPSQANSLDTFCQIRGFAVFPLDSYVFPLPGTRAWHTRQVGDVDVTLFCIVRRFGQGFCNKIIVPEADRTYKVVEDKWVLTGMNLPGNSLIDWGADRSGGGQPIKEQIARTLIRWSGLGGRLTYPEVTAPPTTNIALLPRSISFGDPRLDYRALSNGMFVKKTLKTGLVAISVKNRSSQSNFTKYHQNRVSSYPTALGYTEPIRLLGVSRNSNDYPVKGWCVVYGGFVDGEMVECVRCHVPEDLTPVFLPITEDFMNLADKVPVSAGTGDIGRFLLTNAQYKKCQKILMDHFERLGVPTWFAFEYTKALYPATCRLAFGLNKDGFLADIKWPNINRININLKCRYMK